MGHTHRSSYDLVGEFVAAKGMRDSDGRIPACTGGESFHCLERGSTGEGTLNGLARGDLEEPPLPPRLVKACPPVSLPLAPPLAPPYSPPPDLWMFNLEMLVVLFQEKVLSKSVSIASISAIFIFIVWTAILASS